MNATDIIGWYSPRVPAPKRAGPGAAPVPCRWDALCDDCGRRLQIDRAASTPIFADSEAGCWTHCERCEDLIPETLTANGIQSVLDDLIDGRGRACILRQWWREGSIYLREAYGDRHPKCPNAREAFDRVMQHRYGTGPTTDRHSPRGAYGRRRPLPCWLDFGSISSGTMRPEDVGPALIDALHTVRGGARALAEWRKEWCDVEKAGFDHDDADAACIALQDTLQEFAPPYAYVGAHPGDGADVGVWLPDTFGMVPSECPPKVNDPADLKEVPEDADEALVASDHGNSTLYARTKRRDGRWTGWRVVWSLV